MRTIVAGIVGGAAGGALAIAASGVFVRTDPPGRSGTDAVPATEVSVAAPDDRPLPASPFAPPPDEAFAVATVVSPASAPLPPASPPPLAGPALAEGPSAPRQPPEPPAVERASVDEPADPQASAAAVAVHATAPEQPAASAPESKPAPASAPESAPVLGSPAAAIPPKLAAAAEALRSFRLVVPTPPPAQPPSADPRTRASSQPPVPVSSRPPVTEGAAIARDAAVDAPPSRAPVIVARTSTIPRRNGATRAAPAPMLPEVDASALMRASDAIDRLSRRVRGRNVG